MKRCEACLGEGIRTIWLDGYLDSHQCEKCHGNGLIPKKGEATNQQIPLPPKIKH